MLLLAPWPESLWAFRRIWDRVSAVGRVVAIDMPGFGHSDGRPELIAQDASGEFLARLIDEWSLGAPHVVGPDVGTAAALFLAAKAPAQIVAGLDDDLVPWSNNQYLDDLLPNSEIHPLDAGHFAWEQAAGEYGRLIVDWVSGGYRRVAAG
jgi:pimeloyl-ACP methyl ester carboxylesterase